MNEKVDFKKSLDSYKAVRGNFRVLNVPRLQYLMIDGSGDPNTSSAYTDALEALYPLAYKLKFASKRELGRDYVVPPLEGLWWADDMASFTDARDKSQWSWTMMLMVPEWIDEALFSQTVHSFRDASPPSRLDSVRLARFDEGQCVQTLHVGSFDDEGPVLHQMHHEFIPANGFVMRGVHHEVYLSDPRRTAPEKLRTILRQPISRA